MRKIIFYGDSNTYGFDPRGYLEDRYPESSIWTSLVSETLGSGWNVRNEGMNGRSLPTGLRSLEHVAYILDGLTEEDVFAVMLGSNDLLMTMQPVAERAVARMEGFLDWLEERPQKPRILVVAPVHIGSPDTSDPILARFYDESVRMNEGFRALAARYGVAFIDASAWPIGLAHDGVHFSEEGHARFAEELLKAMRGLDLC